MHTNVALLILGICLLVCSIPAAVNTYQAVNRINLPGSAYAAVAGYFTLLALALCFVIVAKAGK